jgi:four helix bundle protein
VVRAKTGIMADFTKLKIWQRAHELTTKVYALTKKLPTEEDYGLKSQLRRAAISCESNIAEGETRFTTAAKINFFIDARSSCAEVQSHLLVVKDVYQKLNKESLELKSEYEILAKQINSLISFRKKADLITQRPNNLTT